MGLDVQQDSGQLRQIASEINNYAKQIQNSTKMIESAMNNRLGAAESESFFWYGPNAETFLKDFNDKYPEKFENAFKNITSMATNLESQAERWEAFDSQ